jgi:hypothetical protein
MRIKSAAEPEPEPKSSIMKILSIVYTVDINLV